MFDLLPHCMCFFFLWHIGHDPVGRDGKQEIPTMLRFPSHQSSKLHALLHFITIITISSLLYLQP